MTPSAPVLWRPTEEYKRRTALAHYMQWLADQRGREFHGYADLWQWSVAELDEFWGSLWEYYALPAEGDPHPALADDEMPGASWFPGVRLNYAEAALDQGSGLAVIARDETGARSAVDYDELRTAVANLRAYFVRVGIVSGDRVVGYLPNGLGALVGFLAAASLGAIWSSCPPEFGAKSVLDRFAQIEPKLALCVSGYHYGGKRYDRTRDVEKILAGLPSLVAVVSADDVALPNVELPQASYSEIIAGDATLEYERVAFDHPLWILYSSGTTGLPKPIVQGHGGIVLEHLKVLGLQSDIGRGDRFFWFSTTGWMMWNYLISGLLVGATVVLYDGNPGYPDLDALWRMAAEEKLTYFGGGAPYFMACHKAGLSPRERFDLSALRGVGSTGAPLPDEGFDWVYDHVSANVLLGSVSGGTDLCTAFVCSCPLLPVIRGELQCRALGADVQAFDESGLAVIGEVGELVIRKPMPSMPVFFWGDTDGQRYHDSYFARYPGAWLHGDWIRVTEGGGAVISGRSDSTLNRGGVRMGTSDFYRVVEALPEVADSLVVDTGDQLWLFVVVAAGHAGGDVLAEKLHAELRATISPRHVPDHVVEVSGVPRTLSGKKLEVPIKRILGGVPLERAVNPGTLKNPDVLYEVVAAAEQRRLAASGVL